MKFKSPVYSQVSGSVAGLTYAHNQGGLHVRARSIPTNPASAFQDAVRNAFRNGIETWQTLTAAERTGWATYAANTPMLSALGDLRPISAQSQYIRQFVAATVAGLAPNSTAPTAFNLGLFTTPTFSASAATQLLSTVFETDDGWVEDDQGGIALQISRPQNATINFFKGPFRTIPGVLGNSTTPPVSPKTSAVAFPFVAGQALFVQWSVLMGDGRLSTPQVARIIAAA